MKFITKILLTIISILNAAYFLTYIFPAEFHWFVPTMEVYYKQRTVLGVLNLIQILVLFRKIWSFKNIEKSKKSDLTWYLILYYPITSLIFIWKKADEFEELNNKTIVC